MSEDSTRREVEAKETQSLLREMRAKKAGDLETARLAETPVPGWALGPRRALVSGRSDGDSGAVTCPGMPEGAQDKNALVQMGEGRTRNPTALTTGCARCRRRRPQTRARRRSVT